MDYSKPIPLNLKQMFDSVSFVVDSKTPTFSTCVHTSGSRGLSDVEFFKFWISLSKTCI